MARSPEAIERKRAWNREYAARPEVRVRRVEIQRRYHVKAKYGLTLDVYDAALAAPCAICGGVSQVMDHDHTTGENRKALCSNCNVALGLMADDPQRLLAAAEYLGVSLGQEA